MAPHCVVWDHPLPSQLATTERLKYTGKYKWGLQTNVNVCTTRLRETVDSFPTAGWLVPARGAGCVFPLLPRAGTVVACVLPETGEEWKGKVCDWLHVCTRDSGQPLQQSPCRPMSR